MKVVILANPKSTHTTKWVNSLNEKGVDIYLFSLNDYDIELFNKDIKIEVFKIPKKIQNNKSGSFSKFLYAVSLNKLKNFIKKVKPDILHAHYISSYGLLGAMTSFHPYLISVWGTDIYYVPEKNFINRKLIEFSLSKADKIFSTSHVMCKQTKKFTNKEVEVIPFGIDIDIFKPIHIESLFKKEDIVIGTIKTLEKIYGIEYLIRAFKVVKDKLPSISLKLLIVGGGLDENYFKKIIKELELENNTIFTGFIVPNEIPKYHNMIDIFLALSERESFGVSILEASACEKPVIVSDAEGFTEIVKNNLTGFIVEKRNIQQIVEVLTKLVLNKILREKIGKAGREEVIKFYNWKDNVNQIIKAYEEYIKN